MKKRLIASKNSALIILLCLVGQMTIIPEILKLNKSNAVAKMFLGSSTGQMLVDDYEIINKIFRNVDLAISAHCEDEEIINKNLERAKEIWI